VGVGVKNDTIHIIGGESNGQTIDLQGREIELIVRVPLDFFTKYESTDVFGKSFDVNRKTRPAHPTQRYILKTFEYPGIGEKQFYVWDGLIARNGAVYNEAANQHVKRIMLEENSKKP
jgi:hypothetical protein